MENESTQQCTCCLVIKPISSYDVKKNGDINRQCIRCLDSKKKYNHKVRELIKCHHGAIKYQCVRCKGNGICSHNKRRSYCETCCGSQICVHNRQRYKCKECNFENYIKDIIMTRMRIAIGYTDFEYLGCSMEYFIVHIEAQFTEGMTWDNYGKWHFDHKLPLGKKGLTEEEIIERLEFTNVQPLWATDNIRKGNKEL